MAYLLDTNILSELRKGSRCDERVRAWAVAERESVIASASCPWAKYARGSKSFDGRLPINVRSLSSG